MKFALAPKQWDVLTDALKEAGHQQVEIDEAELFIYNGKADEFPELPDNVKWVQLTLAGIDAFFDHGLITDERRWSNASGVYARPVAESAVALLLGCLHLYPRVIREQSWDTTGEVDKDTRWLYNTHVGIIGAGGIGRELIPMLKGFGCEITAVNNSGNPVDGADKTVKAADVDQVWGSVDHVIMAAPLTDETRGIINKDSLAQMKKSAVFVNVGRGPHVVTDDLVDALRSGEIAAAGLDVTDPEPLPDGHPLYEMDNVIITPHVANTVANMPYLIKDTILANIEAYQAGEKLHTEVDPARGY